MHLVKAHLICMRLFRMFSIMSCYLHSNITVVLTAEICGRVMHVKQDCSYLCKVT
jgi:hypothetical protein